MAFPSIKAPSRVKGFNDFTPATGSKQFEYLKIGDFLAIGGSDENVRISPQIKLVSPSDVGDISVKLDPYNGLVFRSKISYQGINDEYVTILSAGGICFDIRTFPSDRRAVEIGGFYRDGEYIKIRTS